MASLDRYIATQASQDMQRKANAVFVLVPQIAPSRIAGYFTLCASALSPGDIPDAVRKRLPRYPLVSTTLIGRLAVDTEYQGRGVGALLLARALRLAYGNADVVGSSMVVVDAMDASAAKFYAAHGFLRLVDSNRLILPMQVLASLLR
ncbi:MAG TPA: GNAT family N-acetyltransferase [Gemmatimonadaceae bacterium]|nr:GNAT family N-acetyltransferase [Gemmatimonadaceae bacterium]